MIDGNHIFQTFQCVMVDTLLLEELCKILWINYLKIYFYFYLKIYFSLRPKIVACYFLMQNILLWEVYLEPCIFTLEYSFHVFVGILWILLKINSVKPH